MQGEQGEPGEKGERGDPGAELRPITLDEYMALSDEDKRSLAILWVLYPDDFFEVV